MTRVALALLDCGAMYCDKRVMKRDHGIWHSLLTNDRAAFGFEAAYSRCDAKSDCVMIVCSAGGAGHRSCESMAHGTGVGMHRVSVSKA
eukprot:3750821-Prymnesium_polylepis.1